MVAARESPSARSEPRRDRIGSIELVGPVTARATVTCAIGDRRFSDLLTLVHLDGRWQVIAKVFHYETEIPPCPTST
jgi:hypothetical protein